VGPERLATGGLLGVAALTAAWATLHPRSTVFGPVVWRGPPDSPRVALTFDDGPHPGSTERIAEILTREGVPGTFFCVGKCIERFPGIARALHRAGHELENHSFSHGTGRHLFQVGLLQADLQRCQDALVGICSVPPRYYRPAVGIRNPVVHQAARELGLQVVTWTSAARDGLFALSGRRATRLGARAGPGSILALHDGTLSDRRGLREHTVQHLPQLLRELKARGLEVVRLDRLLRPA
jgi:peptidoglycan/xylan/chitin deacetylase (PgdA/CDA1 family)